ncbi:PREDICTED: DNA-directed RNA polymerase I subunit RPA43-like isoform X2 [Vollenhovia emeryi]|uniref:DNA-directed RNA polymerase I subunit RPA43-like isoform X1 n=1 Tax=Vollenhovia emeryi TaxID=411798 RepID=UPI0005F4578A|nr:PREDICTED: DNA-directed RNA polymerase I subunit RPA43-like isoform X1 [Vollenhovia emeryi]XP_011879755.1 PREDICTED: DNA-directed RNA polymerase I subunit RPA43-like isoform X2 [Vollenhovia emeryi]
MKNRKVTWANLELAGLLEDEESHVHFTRTTKHLSLHPYYLNNVQGGLNEILRSSLNTYDKELKGFILAFRNLKLLNNLGETLYDSPYIHIDVEADFYLFCPTNGTFLKGIVTKKGLDHIVVLVHKIYTVSIPKPDDTEEWAGDLVEIGQEVRCCVNEVDNRSKPPFIRATLRFDYSQGCRAPESINNIDNVDSAINSVKIEVSTGGVSEDNDVSEKERKKHQKKRKKSRESNSDFVVKVENELESNDNLESDISRIVKSEKKRQSMQDTVLKTDDSINNLEVDNIPKKHKKRKRSLLEEDTISANGVSEDTDASEKERKQHRKKHKKSREDDSNLVIKVENEESSDNLGSNISKIVKSER